jgi:hypothetical protein
MIDYLIGFMKIVNIVALMAAVCIIISVASAGSVIVQARGADGKYLKGGMVTLDGKNKGAIPSKDRTFYIQNLPPGHYVVGFHYCPWPLKQCCYPKRAVDIVSGSDAVYCELICMSAQNQP